MIAAKDLEQRWYRTRELHPPLAVTHWWTYGPDGIVRLSDCWDAQRRVNDRLVTNLWPIIKPLPPGMTEEDDV